MSANNYYGPEDEYDYEEMELLRDELMEDNESWERSNDDGWYYDDDE
ncbi:MAG: hypothetical protein WCP10_15105 [Desulfuromonadales bacterium]